MPEEGQICRAGPILAVAKLEENSICKKGCRFTSGATDEESCCSTAAESQTEDITPEIQQRKQLEMSNIEETCIRTSTLTNSKNEVPNECNTMLNGVEEEKQSEDVNDLDQNIVEMHPAKSSPSFVGSTADYFELLPFANDNNPPKISTCPEKHGLGEFCCGSFFYCNGCGVTLVRGDLLYGCRLCNFDACTNCVDPCVREECLVKQPRCLRKHGMINMRWASTRVCDKCSKHVGSGRPVVSCIPCEYDLCGKCAGFPEQTFYDLLGVAKDATSEEIQTAAWELSIKTRKLASTSCRPARREEAIIHFQDVASAYAILSDPEQRIAYDKYLLDPKGDALDFLESYVGDTNVAGFAEKYKRSPELLLRIPGWKRKPNSTPSFSHGAYVALGGIVYCPIIATLYGAGTFAVSMYDGTKAVAGGFCRGATSLKSGIKEMVTKEKPKQCGAKVFATDYIRSWHTRSRNTPARNIERFFTEPIFGILVGTTCITGGAVAGALCAVGGTAFGISVNFDLGKDEIKEAWAQKRQKSKKKKSSN